jgi:transposase InsO family protein
MRAEGATDDRRSGSGWRSRAHRGRLHRRAKQCLPHARRSRLSAGGATRVSRLPPKSGSRPPPSVGFSGALASTGFPRSSPPSRSVATSAPLPTRSSTSASKNSAGSIGLVTGSPATAPGRAAPAGSDGEYVHLAVDGHSRPAYSEILPDEKRSSLPALSVQRPALLSQPRRQGRARHDDNGSSFRSRRYAKALRLLRIRHLRIKPCTPKSNGKPSASSRPACANWPTPAPAALPTRAPPSCLTGFTATTGIASWRS